MKVDSHPTPLNFAKRNSRQLVERSLPPPFSRAKVLGIGKRKMSEEKEVEKNVVH
jgi:hypothetical protein